MNRPLTLAVAAATAVSLAACAYNETLGRSQFLLVDDAELARREAALGGAYAPRNRERKVSAALRAYAAMATSADKGAVRDVSKLG